MLDALATWLSLSCFSLSLLASSSHGCSAASSQANLHSRAEIHIVPCIYIKGPFCKYPPVELLANEICLIRSLSCVPKEKFSPETGAAFDMYLVGVF
uniref:Secreted protein n=1 Tax=Setaria viridis TaxID=4556 RepID=A0A4V6D5L0_SETVI|nr:hypothetical protein SEVIR_6G198400v2 [Setaria viridis]